MIFKYTLYLLLFSISYSNQYINLDYHITSKINTTDLLTSNNRILVSTNGGIYSINDGLIEDVDLLDAVDILDISEPDFNQKIWLSSKSPGIVQILNSNNTITNVISYPSDIDAIYNVKHSTNKTFAIGCRGDCLNLKSSNNDYFIIVYNDYYFDNIIFNFPQVFNYINDIEVFNDTLYVTSNNGLFSCNLNDNFLLSNNWNHSYESENIISIIDNIALTEGKFINVTNDIFYNYNNLILEGEIIEFYDFLKDGTYYLLTDENLYLVDSSFQVNSNLTINKDSDIATKFSGAAYYNDSFYLGLINNGVVKYNINSQLYSFFSPNTLFQSEFNAITVTDNYLAGISKKGGFILSNINSISNNEIINFYPYAFSDTSLYSFQYPNNISDYNSIELPYWSGGKSPNSILIQNGHLFFANNGSYPFIDDNINYHYNPILNEYLDYNILPSIDYYGALGIYSLLSSTNNLNMKSNGVFGGLGGLLNSNETSGYMTVGPIKSDKDNNIWVVNPFSENYFDNNVRVNRPITYQIFNSLNWNHVYDNSNQYFIPTEISFSENNRLWIGYQFYENDNGVYSKGGIRLLEYNNINNEYDDIWCTVNSSEYDNINVWSLEITKDTIGKEILWILSDLGLKGYYFEIYDISESYRVVELFSYNNTFYFSDLSNKEGCKIRKDLDGNLWVLTVDDGLRIIYKNGDISMFEINKDNFNILSDNITDIGFHKNGNVYISTDLGISVLNTSFTSTYSPSTLSVSPNPFIVSLHDSIIFSNIGPNTSIQIMTLSGLVVKDFIINYNGEVVQWDGTSNSGKKISSGVYLVVSSNQKQNTGVSKIAIIR